jgi:maltoporin
LVTGFVSTNAFAEEPTNADPQQPTETPNAEQPAPEAPGVTVAPDATVVAPVAKPKVGDLTTHGYFRGGFGANISQKGRMTCFKLALDGGILSKYRLGNECEVWGELDLTSVVYAGEDGTVANLHFMPVAFIPTSYIGYSPTGVTSSDLGSANTGATVAFPNLYVDLKGISWLFGGTPWVGTRYYKRESVYISDFFYWNPSGVGAGIEDVNVGQLLDKIGYSSDFLKELRFSYAAFAVDGQPKSSPPDAVTHIAPPALPAQMDLGIRNDVQLRGIRPYQGGEFQIGFQYIADYSNDKDDKGNPITHGGWGITVRHVQDVLGGDNKLVFQYGKSGGTGFGTLGRFYYPDFSIYYLPNESRLRILDVLTIQPNDWLGTQLVGVYQRDNTGTGKTDALTEWYSAGTRVSVALVEHAKLLGEVGFDRVKKHNGADPQWLAKITGALAIAGAKGFWGRPELRLFYTYAQWSKAAAIATVDSGQVYTSPDDNGAYKLSGSIAGLQAEAMW